jgi:GH18 family chitinase
LLLVLLLSLFLSVFVYHSKKNSIQGVDLDYTPRSIKDGDQYVIFLQEAIPQWHEAGLLVSMTTVFHPAMTYVVSQVYQQIDRFHVMTYDMISRNASDNDPYHASLVKTKAMLEALLHQHPGKGLNSMGQSPEKILLGIPAYARHLQSQDKVMTFGEIYDAIIHEQGKDQPSIDWRTLHSWNGFEWESGQRIHDKVKLAKSNGLGGIFFWEIGQDKVTYQHPRGVLLEAAAAAVGEELAIDHPPLLERDNGDEL